METSKKLAAVLESIDHHNAWLDRFGWDAAGSKCVLTCLRACLKRAEKLTAQLKEEAKK